MSWAGSAVNAAKTLKNNRAARNSQRREKDKFGKYLGSSNIELNYNTEPLSEERKAEIHKRVKRQQQKSLLLGLLISTVFLAILIYLAVENWDLLFSEPTF